MVPSKARFTRICSAYHWLPINSIYYYWF